MMTNRKLTVRSSGNGEVMASSPLPQTLLYIGSVSHTNSHL